MDDGWRISITLLLGVLTGALSAMFGVGGAVVSTPGIRALGATPLESVGSTLPSVLPSAFVGTLRYQREGLIRWQIVGGTAGVGALAAVGGALLSNVIPGGGHPLMIATAALMAFTGVQLWRERDAQARVTVGSASGQETVAPAPPLAASTPERVAWWRLAVIGGFAGCVSGLLGVGGGVFMVPAFSKWLGLPIKAAIATSLACVGLLAIPGTLTHWYLGDINWAFAVPLCIGVIPGARAGAALALRTPDVVMRHAVAIALIVFAVVYAVGELTSIST
ncbi:MAG: putative permease [Actinomycetia bacterium]|nr:putative permease [Actinomycetes bacterium]